jgi:hypothetical protein
VEIIFVKKFVVPHPSPQSVGRKGGKGRGEGERQKEEVKRMKEGGNSMPDFHTTQVQTLSSL